MESELKALVETGTGEVAADFPRRKLKTAWLTCVLQVGRSGDARESTGVELKRPSRPDICEIDGALCDMHHGRGRGACVAAGGARAAVDVSARG